MYCNRSCWLGTSLLKCVYCCPSVDTGTSDRRIKLPMKWCSSINLSRSKILHEASYFVTAASAYTLYATGISNCSPVSVPCPSIPCHSSISNLFERFSLLRQKGHYVVIWLSSVPLFLQKINIAMEETLRLRVYCSMGELCSKSTVCFCRPVVQLYIVQYCHFLCIL